MKLNTILIVFVTLLSLSPFAAYFYNNLESKPALDQTVYTPAAIKSDPVSSAKPAPASITKQIDNTKHTTTNESLSKKSNAAIEVKYPPPVNHRSPLGINTNEIYEQDASIPFVDLFRVSMPFHENIRCRKKDMPCLTSAKVEYDKQGWPKKLNGGKAGVFFIRNVNRDAYPEGNYTVLYDGEG